MSKRQKFVSYVILAYLASFILAIIFRIEHYPYTWAHMFSRAANDKASYSVTMLDFPLVESGIEVFFQDGTTGRVNHQDLNIPIRLETVLDAYSGLYRLLTEVCDETEQNFGLFPASTQLHRKNRPRKVLRSILYGFNKTLGNDPQDPKYIVGLRVKKGLITFYDLNQSMRYVVTKPTTPVDCNRFLRGKNDPWN